MLRADSGSAGDQIMAMAIKTKSIQAIRVDRLVLNCLCSSDKPPDISQLNAARVENNPSSDVDNGVTKHARQMKRAPAILNLSLTLVILLPINDFTDFGVRYD